MSLDKQNNSLSDYFLKCSSWACLKKVVAWVLSYRENLLNPSKKRLKHVAPKYITFRELERAEREILWHLQGWSFPEEINYTMKPVKKSR